MLRAKAARIARPSSQAIFEVHLIFIGITALQTTIVQGRFSNSQLLKSERQRPFLISGTLLPSPSGVEATLIRIHQNT